MPNFSAYKLILLTGAGFSKNFGGLLAREMWNRLILSPDIQRHARLRQLLGENFDYESIYQQVMHGNYTQDEKAAMQSAVVEAYSELDAQEIEASRHNEINWTAARQFIAAFSAQRGEKGFVFTVNQDLLVERFLGGENRPLLPGIPPQQVWFDPLSRQQALGNDRYITPFEGNALAQAKEQFLGRQYTFCYVKLHGSMNWRRANQQPLLVVGGAKAMQILQDELLSWYRSLFAETIIQPERRLLIIGYGFQDEHINALIADAITKNGLSWVCVCPGTNEEIAASIRKSYRGDDIWRGMRNLVPHTLRDIFPGNQPYVLNALNTPGWKLLKESFFQ